MMWMSVVLAALLALAPCLPAPALPARTLTVMSWNVESGGADALTIAMQMAAFDDVDIWGLSEVRGAEDADLFVRGAEVGAASEFGSVLGTTGGADRLLALYDERRFDLLGSSELSEVNIGGRVRASLVVTLEETESELQFIFMVNHLYRSSPAARQQQARLLNQWATAQALPVIAAGDYNFDWDVATHAHDLGYDLMVSAQAWRWVRPQMLVTTQCSGARCAFHNVLDFIFVAGAAQAWPATAEIVVREGQFPDDASRSDHRPVQATFALPMSR